jgi:type IV secretory pathway component VirB8
MNSQERNDLLIRLDENVKGIKEWTNKHTQVHKEEKATRLKWSLATFSLVGATIVATIKILLFG